MYSTQLLRVMSNVVQFHDQRHIDVDICLSWLQAFKGRTVTSLFSKWTKYLTLRTEVCTWSVPPLITVPVYSPRFTRRILVFGGICDTLTQDSPCIKPISSPLVCTVCPAKKLISKPLHFLQISQVLVLQHSTYIPNSEWDMLISLLKAGVDVR